MRVAVAGAVAAVLIAGVAVAVNAGGGTAGASGTAVATGTAKVLRTDLAATEQVSGSLGYDGGYTIVNPAGATNAAVTQAQQALAQAQAAQSADQVAAGDSSSSSAQAIRQATAAVAAAQLALATDQGAQTADCAGAAAMACTQDTQKVAQDQAQLATQEAQLATAQLNATHAAHQDQAKAAADAVAVQNATTALATLQATAANPGQTYTALPALGQVLNRGQALYAIDGKPVPLFYGTATMWRAFQPGMADGADVGELTDNLIALGYGAALVPGPHFSAATADAVRRWQAANGVGQTGVVRLGEVVFAAGPLRVSAVHPAAGAAAAPGPVLDVTTTSRVVTVALPVSKEYLVHAGDAVSVLLPDGTTTTGGHVRDVATVAVAPASGGGGNSGPTVAVTITLDNPAQSGNLDQAPVTVNITDQAVHGVLAVPINALLALAEGGSAVEIESGGTRRLVAVHTGLFGASMVEVSGAGITEGTAVEVPAS